MTTIPLPRRFLVAAVALALAAFVFHIQLASAVVTRGDDALRSGDIAGAMRYYARAERLDPASTVAADRLAFNLAMRHDRDDARLAIAVANNAIDVHPRDASLFADRGFAELQFGAWRRAEVDFGQAGSLGHDARYDHFASRMALRVSDRVAARRYAERALHEDPAFAPARALLRALR
jgi:tetratricopeptide (TPR) repeat protein